ncbi:hypothetical protein V7111_07220 [Neobacillus niacini]|uniref:hypothetical protein n=1 Tax=Neobacillus niacini TaxID=86668 RepID=UPI002FFFA67A
MPEFEDMILPDDFEASPQVEEVGEPLEVPADEEALPQATEPTEAETLQMLKVKYNKEEREIPIDEAIPLVQKGLNYDKTLERLQALESDPRLSFVEELAQQNGMDVPSYLEAVKQQREQERINQLVEQGISEELAQEMLENRKFREQFEAEKKAKAEEEKANADYNEFFDYFRQANDRDFNAQSDAIPESVWQATQSGVPLKYAYMEHQNNQFKQQLQTLKQNQSNAQKAPVGSVTAHGSTEVASEDVFMQGFNSIK